MAHREKFLVNSKIKVLDYDAKYKEIFAESALIFTDSSSLVFDFTYLKKPIFYVLFDSDGGNLNYEKGYFDRKQNGFGEVVYDVDSTINLLIEYMKNDCKLKDKYKKRIDNFFAFVDKKNCERVYKEILKLER